MGASAVVCECLEAASSGKTTKTRIKKTLSELKCSEQIQIREYNSVSRNLHPSLNRTNPHGHLLLIYQPSHIVSNRFGGLYP